MRCGKARRLMLLYRKGELSSRQQAALARHFASCQTCAQAAKRIADDFAAVDALRGVPPMLSEPRALTLSIMRAIEMSQNIAPSVDSPLRSVGRVLSVFRLAGAATACVLVVLYVVLSYNDARTMASLEERLWQRGGEKGSAAERLAREAASQFERRSPGAFSEAGLRPDEMGRALEFLVSTRPEPTRVTLEDLLLRKYPSLASVTLQDGLDDRERTILASDGERFLKDLESLTRKEHVSHEH